MPPSTVAEALNGERGPGPAGVAQDMAGVATDMAGCVWSLGDAVGEWSFSSSEDM